ncbi:UvrD-helicase domain-containing protein [Methanotrichaceae archaeon M04Ac]|uniref:DNA 3'-5' helicase n=1 Tax=Candidatus Methanocrinis alkalitolerans TaxID=3033395 RepID=A0ABT5XHM4_9EURY|nr:UvrD-helicase domain-containing protein [Candidatus Methanocrinis alkalitolerans]MDF0594215.1 UvrD-helicase domain-containing protein [Candidatus Methanocrinis alkalitolerans]
MKGDLFISASAGTGKTFAISERYVEIFEEAFRSGEEIDVGDVAAITFTRKAAGEMKERIVGMIGDRAGGDPRWRDLLSSIPFAWIGTIDSFAGRILLEVGPFAGIDPGLRVAAASIYRPISRREALRGMVENEDLLEPLLKVSGLDRLLEALMVGEELYRDKILAARPAGPADGGVPLHQDPGVAADLAEANGAFLSLFSAVDTARLGEMEREGVTDFSGVLLALRDLLVSRPEARRHLRGRFRYIIIDEFQDTDHLQTEIVDLLRGPDTRVVYVGDAKQSIYRFRGAEVEAFGRARTEVESSCGVVRTLDKNYRSHPRLLDFTNLFFSGIFRGGGPLGCAPVIPLPTDGVEAWEPRAKLLFHREDEAMAAAVFIKSLVGRNFSFVERRSDGDGHVFLAGRRRRIYFRDFAILIRKLRGGTGDRYRQALQNMGIPCYVVGESGFFDLPEIKGLVSILSLLADPGDDLAAATALLSPAVGLDLQNLARLRFRGNFTDGEDGGRLRVGLIDCIPQMEEGDIAPGRMKRLLRYREVFDRLMERRDLLKPSEILKEAADGLDYEVRLAKIDPLRTKTANFRKLFEAAEALDEAAPTLREVVSRLDGSSFEELAPASVESEETDAVKVMTVHQAKGLEFPVVIVAETSWSRPAGSPPFHLRREGGGKGEVVFTLIPKEKAEEGTALFEMVEEEEMREAEEEKRTLYVASTRATDLLGVTLTTPKTRGSRPWRDLLSGLVEAGEDPAEAPKADPAFEGIVEVVDCSAMDPSGAVPTREEREPREPVIPDLGLIDPIGLSHESLRISPTWLSEEGTDQDRPPGSMTVEDYDLAGEEEEPLVPKDLGRLAHQILERLGEGGRTLASLGSAERPTRPPHLLAGRFGDDELREVWAVLDRLKDHELVREIESAEEVRTEYQIIRPFGEDLLVGRVDKLVRDEEGWRIVDFKFADSATASPGSEFQMKFYIYLARELFCPLLGARLFYLKDGAVQDVFLEDELVEGFELELSARIEEAKGRSTPGTEGEEG